MLLESFAGGKRYEEWDNFIVWIRLNSNLKWPHHPDISQKMNHHQHHQYHHKDNWQQLNIQNNKTLSKTALNSSYVIIEIENVSARNLLLSVFGRRHELAKSSDREAETQRRTTLICSDVASEVEWATPSSWCMDFYEQTSRADLSEWKQICSLKKVTSINHSTFSRCY